MNRTARTKTLTPLRKQRGAVFALGLVMVAAAFAVLMTGFLNNIVQASNGAFETEKASYVRRVAKDVDNWYQLNYARLVDGSFNPNEAALLREAINERQFGVRLQISNIIGAPPNCPNSNIGVGRCVPYRNIAIWVPKTSGGDTTTFNPTTGALTPDPDAYSVNYAGRDYAMKLATSTVRQMDRLGALLQGYYSTVSERSPTADFGRNYFRAIDCNARDFFEIACYDNYAKNSSVPADQGRISALIGIDEAQFITVYGTDVEVSNLEDSRTADLGGLPPYSMALRARTPWGAFFRLTVAQPA